MQQPGNAQQFIPCLIHQIWEAPKRGMSFVGVPNSSWTCSCRKGSSRDSQDFPACPTEAPVSLRMTKILPLQAAFFKPVFLNTKCPSLSLEQQQRNEGNEGTFPQVFFRFFLGKAGQEFVRSGWKACKGHRNCSPHIFPRLSATNPHFSLHVTFFWGRQSSHFQGWAQRLPSH